MNLFITADTVVVVDQQVLGKPRDVIDARRMLHLISGRSHQVVTGGMFNNKTVSTLFFSDH